MVKTLGESTRAALEEALLIFAGSVLIISHDRWFLDRVATHMLAFEGDSQVVWFEGNYEDYEADRHRRLGIDADKRHQLVELLNTTLAATSDLYSQTKQAHWNVKGKDFYQLHLLYIFQLKSLEELSLLLILL